VGPWTLPIHQDTFYYKSYYLGEGATVCLTTTIVAALAMLLICISCTCLLGTVLVWQDLRVRDLTFFLEACEAIFLVAIASLKMLFGPRSLDLEKE